jgi:hypothetical protein
MAIKEGFKMLWDTKVKQTAVDCLKTLKDADAETIMIGMLPEEEKESATEAFLLKYVDTTGMDYISQMIGAIEHDLADNRIIGMNAINLISAVKGCLNKDNESYWTNVWKNDLTSETAQNFVKLGNEMEELVRVM